MFTLINTVHLWHVAISHNCYHRIVFRCINDHSSFYRRRVKFWIFHGKPPVTMVCGRFRNDWSFAFGSNFYFGTGMGGQYQFYLHANGIGVLGRVCGNYFGIAAVVLPIKSNFYLHLSRRAVWKLSLIHISEPTRPY